MQVTARHVVALYVHRVSQRWVARDTDGNFWSLSSTDNSWEERQPFLINEETELEIVPGHYRDMLGLPS